MSAPQPPQKKLEIVDFANIRADNNSDVGTFRISGPVFGWKNARTKVAIEHKAQLVDEIEWSRCNQREFSLIVTTRDKERFEFAGFREPDFEVLSSYIKKNWKRNITVTKLGCKGWHWGQYSLRNGRFCFDVDGKCSFELPLKNLASVNTSKNDISIELKDTGSQSMQEDHLVELRFCVPPPKEGDPIETAELMKANLLDISGLAGSDTEMITSFVYKQCSRPPGRFDVQIYATSLKLHGKSSDFTVSFDNINELYVLPSSGGISVLMLSLINPLKKGQTKYPAVIVQLEDKREVNLSINLDEEQLLNISKSMPNIKTEMTEMEHVLAGDLLSALSGHKILSVSSFKASTDLPCFECSHKISSGQFYPLDNRFIFIPKPVEIVRFDEVASVDFGRAHNQTTRLFEFQLTLKNGTEIEFSSVNRQELQPFKDFITQKGLKIRSLTTISREDRADMEEDDNDEANDDDESDEIYDESEEGDGEAAAEGEEDI